MRRVLGWVAVIVVVAGLAAGGWWAWTQVGSPRYVSAAKVGFHGELKPLPVEHPAVVAALVEPGPTSLDARAANHAVVLTAHDVLRLAVERPAVQATAWFAGFEGEVSAAALDLARRVRVDHRAETAVLDVSVWMDDPAEAAVVLGAWIEAGTEMLRQGEEGQMDVAQVALLRERDQLSEDLQMLQMRAEAFIRNNDFDGSGAPVASASWFAERRLALELEMVALAVVEAADGSGALESERVAEGASEAEVEVEAEAALAGEPDAPMSVAMRALSAQLSALEDAQAEARVAARRHFELTRTLEDMEQAMEPTIDRLMRLEASLSGLRDWHSSAPSRGLRMLTMPSDGVREGWRWPW